MTLDLALFSNPTIQLAKRRDPVAPPSGATLISRWGFGESSGTTVVDSVSARNGTSTSVTLGGDSLVTGDASKCYIFNGAGSKVAVPHHANFLLSTYTVHGYFMVQSLPNTSAGEVIWQKDAPGTPGGASVEVFNQGGVLRLRAYTKNAAGSAQWVGSNQGLGTLSLNTGYEFELRVGSGETRLYLDKTLLGQTTNDFGLVSNTQEIGIGVYRPSTSSTAYFHGYIDRISLYSGLLSGAERSALPAAQTPDLNPGGPAPQFTVPLLLSDPTKTFQDLDPQTHPDNKRIYNLPDNRVIDARDVPYTNGNNPGNGNNYKIELRSQNNGTGIFGYKCVGQQSRNLPWWDMKEYYDGDHLRCEPRSGYGGNGKPLIIEFCWLDNGQDAISVPSGNYQNAYTIIRHCYIRYQRDDVENDNCSEVLMHDCLIDGTFAGISRRPGSSQQCPLPARTTTIRDCIIICEPMPYTVDQGNDPPSSGSLVDGKGHSMAFKIRGNTHPMNCENVIVYYPQKSVNGWDSMKPPNGTHSNCTMVYTGGPSWGGGSMPPGWTLSNDVSIVSSAREQWIYDHGGFDQTGDFSGDDFPWLHKP